MSVAVLSQFRQLTFSFNSDLILFFCLTKFECRIEDWNDYETCLTTIQTITEKRNRIILTIVIRTVLTLEAVTLTLVTQTIVKYFTICNFQFLNFPTRINIMGIECSAAPYKMFVQSNHFLFYSFLFFSFSSRFCFLTSDKLILGQILLILLSGVLVYQNHSVKCFLYFAEKNCQWQTRFKVDVWFGLECCRARVWTSWI